ncbi:MAG: efflux RND transporter periplasmic adaptor subunit [Hyphomicrobiaceae bacterium]
MIACFDVRGFARRALFLLVFASGLAGPIAHSANAHSGHDHEAPSTTGAAPISPRITAVSETFQFVGIAEGEVLVIYLDRFSDNAPVTSAKLEVTIGDTASFAELQKNGTYEVSSKLLKQTGSHEVLINIVDGNTTDLLAGSITIPSPHHSAEGFDHGIWAHVAELVGASQGSLKQAGWIAGGGFGFFGIALLLARRRRALAAILVLLSVAVVSTTAAFAGPDHDHRTEPVSGAAGNAPQRLPDGTILLPKPTQRLLEIRTRIVQPENHRRAIHFVGRVVANPNRSGVVQSTMAGRYLPPPGGLSLIGATINAGDLMGSVAPSFISKDASDMTQTLGDLEQQIALARSKLSRQENLLDKKVVAEAAVEEIRIQLDGLLKRRKELLSAKIEPEELRAPVDGVITAVRVVAGQVVSQTDILFEIVDPKSLMVEALIFDQSQTDEFEDAVSSTSNNVRSKLRFVGRSRALQQQYAILKFEVVDPSPSLNIGTPVTITGYAGAPIEGIVIPRAAVAQAPNGQMIVFRHKEPEIFEPRAVRYEPFGPDSVRITAGLKPDDKIVIEGAPLVNQVR